ncbi:uncharacterized protein LOC130737081 [Lotus japonicus]|uniref:uncharacterized protein LOC130737081 n=1 Tax=Lotus japonicus TaxID=34305 RepID=UPI002589AB2F|nr:uncharacterized protein LOC130737081 [Lotus japonicus]
MYMISPCFVMCSRDILELICKKLTIPDVAAFSSVCKNWHSATIDKAWIWVPETPWIVDNDPPKLEYRLYNWTHERHFEMIKGVMHNNTLINGSCKGWLIVRSDDQMCIWNLFSKAGYLLPPQHTNEYLRLPPFVFTASTCPHLNPITVVGVSHNQTLVWCSIGDKKWKDYRNCDEDDGPKYANVAFLNDQLYAIRVEGNTIDIFGVDGTQPYLIPLRTVQRATAPTEIPSQYFDLYLVESKGHMLAVTRYCHEDSVRTIPISGTTIGFQILKVEEDMLVNVESLEDQALFVGGLSCESLPSNHCPGHHENHIYFIGEHEDEDHYEWGHFKVDDKSMVKKMLEEPKQNFAPTPIWLLPRYKFNCNC